MKYNFDIFNKNEYNDMSNIFNIQKNTPIFWDEKYKLWVLIDNFYIKQYINDYKTFSVSDTFFIGDILSGNYSNPLQRMDHPHCAEDRRETMLLLSNKMSDDWVSFSEKLLMSLFNKKNNYSLMNDIIYPYLIYSNLYPIKISHNEYLKIKDTIHSYSISFDKNINNNTYYNLIFLLKEILQNKNLSLSKRDKKVHVDLLYSGTSTIISSLKEVFLNKNINTSTNKAFINECLRHSSKASFVLRKVKKDLEINNIKINKNDNIIFHLGAANFQQSKWGSNSLDFNCEREYENISISFGYGPHRCVGYIYALKQIEIYLDVVKNINISNLYIEEMNNFDLRMYHINDIKFNIE